ncbi:MAG TPA: hypothetical protein PK688_07135, partial [Tenuifilaceae bacterium]|nr:hypothetical protein [Tenuifilaceae bacterium]
LDFLWFFLVSRQERTLSILFTKISMPTVKPRALPWARLFRPFGAFGSSLSRLFVSKLFRPFRACKNRSLHARGIYFLILKS